MVPARVRESRAILPDKGVQQRKMLHIVARRDTAVPAHPTCLCSIADGRRDHYQDPGNSDTTAWATRYSAILPNKAQAAKGGTSFLAPWQTQLLSLRHYSSTCTCSACGNTCAAFFSAASCFLEPFLGIWCWSRRLQRPPCGTRRDALALLACCS